LGRPGATAACGFWLGRASFIGAISVDRIEGGAGAGGAKPVGEMDGDAKPALDNADSMDEAACEDGADGPGAGLGGAADAGGAAKNEGEAGTWGETDGGRGPEVDDDAATSPPSDGGRPAGERASLFEGSLETSTPSVTNFLITLRSCGSFESTPPAVARANSRTSSDDSSIEPPVRTCTTRAPDGVVTMR